MIYTRYRHPLIVWLSLFGLCMIIAALLSGCRRYYAPDKLVEWVENPKNGLKRIRPYRDLLIGVQYMPEAYLKARQVLKGQSYEYDSMQHYILTLDVANKKQYADILKYGITNMQEYQKRLYYFSYRIHNDLKLVDGGDTLACVLSHFQRSFDLSSHRTFLLSFEDKTPKDVSNKILIFDAHHFDKGFVKMRINKQSIEKTPYLKPII